MLEVEQGVVSRARGKKEGEGGGEGERVDGGGEACDDEDAKHFPCLADHPRRWI